MFAYCNNNPLRYVDRSGTSFTVNQDLLSPEAMLFGAATAASVAILTNPEVAEALSNEFNHWLSYVKQEIYEYAQVVKQEILELGKKFPHVHHIVPVGNFSSRSATTQLQINELHTLLSKAEINRYIDPMNLMLVSAGTHATLHTDLYIAHVHNYLMATDGSKMQIYRALFLLRIEIAARDIFASGY